MCVDDVTDGWQDYEYYEYYYQCFHYYCIPDSAQRMSINAKKYTTRAVINLNLKELLIINPLVCLQLLRVQTWTKHRKEKGESGVRMTNILDNHSELPCHLGLQNL